MCEPGYQEFLAGDIPTYEGENMMKAKVIAGEVFGVKGPIIARTPTYFIDFIFGQVDTEYTHTIPKGWNAMIILYEGSLQVQNMTEATQSEVSCVVFK